MPQDFVEALKWYRKAAQQGIAKSQSSLGKMYALGNGVPTDYVLSYMWNNLAASKNISASKIAIEVLTKYMTIEQIAEAQKMSREWMAKHSEKE